MTAQIDVVPEEFAGRRARRGDDSSGTASVTKALRLLDVFRSDGPVLGVSELARQAGVAKSTAFRLLALLEDAELVERDGRGYRLSWRLFELGTSVQRRWPSGLREIAAPWLTEVFVRAGGNVVHLAVLDGTDVLYLDKVSSPRSPRVPTAVGSRVPADVHRVSARRSSRRARRRSSARSSRPACRASPPTRSRSPAAWSPSSSGSGRPASRRPRGVHARHHLRRRADHHGCAHHRGRLGLRSDEPLRRERESRLVRWAARRIAIDLGADAAASTAGL